MTKPTDQRPATVPFGATPAGQPPTVKEWANRNVWTDRMLDALQKGVRGGKWHTLYDKVFLMENLFSASQSVLGNRGAAGVDHQTVEQFWDHILEEVRGLGEELRSGKSSVRCWRISISIHWIICWPKRVSP
jgi:RNA-directed DNA polymerase